MLFSHHFSLFQAILDQGFEAGPIAASKEVLGDRLTYRGISYRRPTTSENVSFAANGTYRGGTWHSQPQSWVPDATVVLRYRGCCYLKQS
ncbi:DUF4278 domain-containing protein [Oculatella sp. FACHB-28]|uniref:DUF4278 domain-containing protein n=1 Tax=Cyanophyceae TaxID=3028117 RepID=UPI00168466C6|nr:MULTISPECIES: DUF4278 domain-containing protein [Cyanophyceae]MBD1995687.1 DUF4278 domain-containing protein [Leptolyngbya sp. FACHB-541]MBD2055903.1 DUF4278 domain-containing protein [Oculatella sp. FACHB-28]